MPELPEVERVKLVLTPQLVGRTIEDVTVIRPVIAHPSAEAFCHAIRGQTVESLTRRGKFLSFGLLSGDRLLVHLRMTGQLIVTPPKDTERIHTRIVFSLDDGRELRFIDMRGFGRIWLIRACERDEFSGIEKLGPEPFDAELTPLYLEAALKNRKITVKQALMEQTLIAGIGNIYADEALFDAQISPLRRAGTLTATEWSELLDSLKKVLLRSLRENEVTAEEYLAGDGESYRSKPNFRVYGKEKRSCPHCGAPIARVKIAGRSSYYCPHCQHAPTNRHEPTNREDKDS